VNHGVRPLGRVYDIHRTLIQNRMIVGFHANANYFVCLACHGRPPGNFPFLIAKITIAYNAGNLKSYRFWKITSTAYKGVFLIIFKWFFVVLEHL
jgi:hypothetical protein